MLATGAAPIAWRPCFSPTLLAASGMDNFRNYKISHDALNQPSPLDDILEQYMAQIRAKLAEGISVTLIYGGRRLRTFHPDGTIEHHDF